MKKIYMMFTIIFILFSLYLHALYFPKSYELSYKKDGYNIKETYDKNRKMYKVTIFYNDLAFPLSFSDNYNVKRKIIDNIKVVKNDKDLCLSIKINKNLHPICYNDNALKDFRLLTIKEEFKSLLSNISNEMVESYNNLKIYNTLNKNFYIWNYKGYDYISEEKKHSINLLSNDNYNNSLAYKTSRYLITPNYDSKYYFTNYYVIDNNKKELSDLKLDKEISYSSYYLGEFNKNIYLVDKKHKIQYKLNLKKETVDEIGSETKSGITYINNKAEKVSLTKLSNKEYKISKSERFEYKIIDKKLYFLIDEYKILISKNNVKDIININNDEVYYLVNDLLYMFKPNLGEVKLIENSEWNFNYKNHIYIFD